MKYLNKIKAWYKKVVSVAKQRRTTRKRMSLVHESRESIQVMEFDGELYLCVRGIPILEESDLKACDILLALENSRSNYIEYATNKYM